MPGAARLLKFWAGRCADDSGALAGGWIGCAAEGPGVLVPAEFPAPVLGVAVAAGCALPPGGMVSD